MVWQSVSFVPNVEWILKHIHEKHNHGRYPRSNPFLSLRPVDRIRRIFVPIPANQIRIFNLLDNYMFGTLGCRFELHEVPNIT